VQCSASGKPTLVVVGSVNADLVFDVPRLPAAGETLEASAMSTFPGGKGANQAAAAARLGCRTYFVGQVGKDANASMLQRALEDSAVDTTHLRPVDGPSGTAVVLLQPSGENSIIIVGGANTAEWTFSPAAEEVLRGADVLLLQREVPEHVNIHAAELAEAASAVVLDCGGAEGPLSPQLLALVDVVSPNETELQSLTGMPTETEEQAVAAARQLLKKGPMGFVLIKRGAAGSLLVTDGGDVLKQEAVTMGDVVDTTGAGDCFTAAYAGGVLQGRSEADALRYAAAAAGFCVTHRGAMPSLPWKEDLEEWL